MAVNLSRPGGRDNVRKAIEDAVYTAVGLAVLALQEVRVRRRESRQCAVARVREVQSRVDSLSRTVQGWVEPVAARLPVPSLLSQALETGRAQVDVVLRRRPSPPESKPSTPAAA
jgi:hypothetical protein